MKRDPHQAVPAATESYRAATKEQLWLDHRRKKCACGATITEKQQRLYGGCLKCWEKK